jgi:hypothetical protein
VKFHFRKKKKKVQLKGDEVNGKEKFTHRDSLSLSTAPEHHNRGGPSSSRGWHSAVNVEGVTNEEVRENAYNKAYAHKIHNGSVKK